MHQLRNSWSSSSIGLCVLLIAIASLLELPIFPNRRTSNDAKEYFGIWLYTVCSGFLWFEIRAWSKLSYLCKNFYYTLKLWILAAWNNLKNIFNCTLGVCPCPVLLAYYRLTPDLDQDQDIVYEYENAPLAYIFFMACIILQFWAIVDDSIVMYYDPVCFHPWKILNNFLKLVFAILLILAICFKNHRFRGTGLSYFRWSIIGAGSYSAVINYMNNEVSLGYIEVVEEAFHFPEYAAKIGLNITGYDGPDQYMELIFRRKAHCLKSVLSPRITEIILDLTPAATEFFSISICFCVVTWQRLRNTGAQADYHVLNHDFSIPTPIRSTAFLSRTFAWIVSVIAVPLTAGSFYIIRFNLINNPGTLAYGFWCFHVQQFILELAVFLAEFIFYLKYLRNEVYDVHPPPEFQLDALLLVYPLLPLAVIESLRVLPYLLAIQGTTVRIDDYLGLFLIVFQYFQSAFQAVFISEIFCRIHSKCLTGAHHFFRMLMVLNFCMWFSISLELKSIIFHDRISFKLYGIWVWIIIAYSTVPFMIFCFAHGTSCFYEIANHVVQSSNNNSVRTSIYEHDDDSDQDEQPTTVSVIVKYIPNQLHNLNLLIEEVKQRLVASVLRGILRNRKRTMR